MFVARAAVASMIKADGSSDDSGPDGSARSRGRILNYMYMYDSRASVVVSNKATEQNSSE